MHRCYSARLDRLSLYSLRTLRGISIWICGMFSGFSDLEFEMEYEIGEAHENLFKGLFCAAEHDVQSLRAVCDTTSTSSNS